VGSNDAVCGELEQSFWNKVAGQAIKLYLKVVNTSFQFHSLRKKINFHDPTLIELIKWE